MDTGLRATSVPSQPARAGRTDWRLIAAAWFVLCGTGWAQSIEVTPLPEPGTVQTEPVPPRLIPVVAVLRGLDKVTGRAQTFEIQVGDEMQFGRLTVAVQACNGRAPDEPPESAAFLQIYDGQRMAAARLMFSGWMFASSPGLSAMDHARYDIWVLDCRSALLQE